MIVTTVSEVRTTVDTSITSLTLRFHPPDSDIAESRPAIISFRASSKLASREGLALGEPLGDAEGDGLSLALGLPEGEAEGEGLSDALGEPLGEAEGDGDSLALGDSEGEAEGEGLSEALGEPDGLPDGLPEGDPDGEPEGEPLGDPDGEVTAIVNAATIDTDLVVPVASTADIVPVAAVSVFTASATANP